MNYIIEEKRAELKAYLKAAENSVLPGDKYRYYYNILEIDLPFEFPFLIMKGLRKAYVLGLWNSINAFVETIDESAILYTKRGEAVILDEVGAKFRDRIDKLRDNFMDDISELADDSKDIQTLHKIFEGKLRGEESKLGLTISDIPEDEIIEFLNTEEGKYYLTQTKWHNLGKLEIGGERELYKQIAERIYKIRNMVVHSKDYDKPRIIPYSKDEKYLCKEIPLVKFLAEWIVKSSDSE